MHNSYVWLIYLMVSAFAASFLLCNANFPDVGLIKEHLISFHSHLIISYLIISYPILLYLILPHLILSRLSSHTFKNHPLSLNIVKKKNVFEAPHLIIFAFSTAPTAEFQEKQKTKNPPIEPDANLKVIFDALATETRSCSSVCFQHADSCLWFGTLSREVKTSHAESEGPKR